MAARGRKEQEIGSAALPTSPLGATIRALRRKQGLSLTDLAQRAGLHSSGRSYLSKIEHGHITRLGQRQLGRLADALSVSSDQLAVVMHQTLAAKMARQDGESATTRLPAAAVADGARVDALDTPHIHATETSVAPHLMAQHAGELIDVISRRVVEQVESDLQTLLAGHTAPLPAGAPSSSTNAVVPALLRTLADDRQVAQASTTAVPAPPVASGSAEARRGAGWGIEVGPASAAAAAIRLVRQAAASSTPATDPIIVTWLRDTDLFTSVPHLRAGWQAALSAVIESGRTIVHLVRLSRHIAKAPGIVDYIRALLGTTNARALYIPIIVSQLDQGGMPDECVLVPGQGALEIEAAESATATIARLEPPGERFDELYAAALKLREAGTPVYKGVWPRPSSGFAEAITRAEQAPGSRYLLMNGLSESTVPIASHEWRARTIMAQGGVDVARIQHILANRMARAQAVAQTLTTYRVRDFCPRTAISAYIETGVYSSDDALLQLAAKPVHMDKTNIERHLKHLLARLMMNPRYQLILLDDSEAELCRAFCMVKQNASVLLEFWPLDPTGQPQQTDIEIAEPSIVHSFWRDPFWTERAADEDAERRRSIEALQLARQRLSRSVR